MTYLHPTSLSMLADTSPVNAPTGSAHMDCAPSAMMEDLSPRAVSHRYTKGGHTAISTGVWPGKPSSSASISSAFSAREPCIFQFPAISGRRIALPRKQLAPAKGAEA